MLVCAAAGVIVWGVVDWGVTLGGHAAASPLKQEHQPIVCRCAWLSGHPSTSDRPQLTAYHNSNTHIRFPGEGSGHTQSCQTMAGQQLPALSASSISRSRHSFSGLYVPSGLQGAGYLHPSCLADHSCWKLAVLLFRILYACIYSRGHPAVLVMLCCCRNSEIGLRMYSNWSKMPRGATLTSHIM